MARIRFSTVQRYFYFINFKEGVLLSVIISFTVYITSAIANGVLDNAESDESIIYYQYRNVYIFLGCSMAVCLYSFWAVSNQSKWDILLNTVLQLGLLIVYIIFFINSLKEAPTFKYYCLHLRCAETFWLRGFEWRYPGHHCDPDDKDLPRPAVLYPYAGIINAKEFDHSQIVEFPVEVTGKKTRFDNGYDSRLHVTHVYPYVWIAFMIILIALMVCNWFELTFISHHHSEI